MNTHNVNIKTATPESLKTWVKQNFDVLLATRTSRLINLAKLEGDLMMYRSLASLGEGAVDEEDLYDAVRWAAKCINRMVADGDIATPAAYELALSVQTLAETLWSEVWEEVKGAGLPDLADLQTSAEYRRTALRRSFTESARPFGVIVSGHMEFFADDPFYGTYWDDGEVCLGRADTLEDAMELLIQADASGDWNMRMDVHEYRDEDFGRDRVPVSFSPHIVTITDLAGRVVLCGNALTLVWSVPETDPAVLERIAVEKDVLLREAAQASDWDNDETARQLRSQAALLDMPRIHPVWHNTPEVAAALRNYIHPKDRTDGTTSSETGHPASME
ncbi:hypothetical protein [Pantoea cypripedii]|uniref:Uncharacterized protein n=1 Tax=Pantoea cypripedii TaxID=55209 RepID=A0A1X1EKV9_PANCY|nr:hypothetical protein [Pantoea cypripedii]MBP2199076.1 hypothetical protein [Pantoea cypripedii]ORM89483.1 hypothetical protein HA50_22920 [Pantoea cypripedii]